MSTPPSFSLPEINDQDGAWGPSSSHLPAQFKDIPYAPYSKSDKLGRFADWNDLDGTARAGTGAPAPTGAPRSGGRYGGRGREQTAFGSGTASAFAYFHVEDEASFSLVDNKTAAPRRGGPTFGRGRGGTRGAGAVTAKGQRGGRGGWNQSGRGSAMRGGRRGWRDWEKVR